MDYSTASSASCACSESHESYESSATMLENEIVIEPPLYVVRGA
jgi:hypothetical protein